MVEGEISRFFSCHRAEKLEIFDELEEWHLIQASLTLKLLLEGPSGALGSQTYFEIALLAVLRRQGALSSMLQTNEGVLTREGLYAGALLHSHWDQQQGRGS